MDELTFMELAAKEVERSDNERLLAIYAWCKSIYNKVGSCGGFGARQDIHAATAAADILLKVGLIEETWQYMEPHRVDTILDEQDLDVPKYFYENNKTLQQVKITVSMYDNRTNKRSLVFLCAEDKLVLQLQSKLPDAPESETGVIVTA